MVVGETTTKAELDYEQHVCEADAKIGYNSFEDDLSSVHSKGLSAITCIVDVRIKQQSPDIAGGVRVGKDEMDVGADERGIMFGYATDETEDCMPLTHSIATRLCKKFADARKDGSLWWLRPDGSTQVTIEYLQKVDGSVEPLKLHTVEMLTQHAEPGKATRGKEVAAYTGPDATAPSMIEIKTLIIQQVLMTTLADIVLKNGEPATTLYSDRTDVRINPSGHFIIGGPQRNAGLTGRKIHDSYIWRLVRVWRRCLFRPGSHKGCPQCSLCLPQNSKVNSQKRPVQTCIVAAFIWYGYCKASLTFHRNSRDTAEEADSRGYKEHSKAEFRLSPRGNGEGPLPPTAKVPGNRSFLSLRESTVQRERNRLF